MVRIKQTARKTANVPQKGWKRSLIISKAKKAQDIVPLKAAEVDQLPAAKKPRFKQAKRTQDGAKDR
jgi:hypothetical protein